MTDDADDIAPKHPDAQPPTPKQDATPPPASKPIRLTTQLKLSLGLLALISLGSGGLVVWGGAQLLALKQQITPQDANSTQAQAIAAQITTATETLNSQLDTQLDANQQQLQHVSSQLTQQRQAQDKISQQLDRQQQQLAQLEVRWQSAFHTTRLERHVARLETLLQDAQRQLYLTQSFSHTRSLLESALIECKRARAAQLTGICQSIRYDIQRLGSSRLPDHSQLVAQLDQVSIWLNQGLFKHRRLQFSADTANLTPSNKAQSAQGSAPSQTIPTGFSAQLALAQQRLGQFLRTHIVRIHEIQPNGLLHLTLEQAASLHQQAALLIQQARSAVVLRDTQLYQDALAKLLQLITRYELDFENYYPDTQQALKNLQAVQLDLPADMAFKAIFQLNQIRDNLTAQPLETLEPLMRESQP